MSGTGENPEDDEGAESLKDEEIGSKGEGSPKPETPRDIEVDPEVQSVDKEDQQQGDESVIDPEADQDQEAEKKSKTPRGKGGGRGGAKGKGRRGGLAPLSKRGSAFSINTRGTPRGTPKAILQEDDAESVAPAEDAALVKGTEYDSVAHTPTKGKGRKTGETKRRGNWRTMGVNSGVEVSAPPTPMLDVMDDVQMTTSVTEDILPTESVPAGEHEEANDKHEGELLHDISSHSNVFFRINARLRFLLASAICLYILSVSRLSCLMSHVSSPLTRRVVPGL